MCCFAVDVGNPKSLPLILGARAYVGGVELRAVSDLNPEVVHAVTPAAASSLGSAAAPPGTGGAGPAEAARGEPQRSHPSHRGCCCNLHPAWEACRSRSSSSNGRKRSTHPRSRCVWFFFAVWNAIRVSQFGADSSSHRRRMSNEERQESSSRAAPREDLILSQGRAQRRYNVCGSMPERGAKGILLFWSSQLGDIARDFNCGHCTRTGGENLCG